MQPFPHVYTVVAEGGAVDSIELTTDGPPVIVAAAPREFGGSGDEWSPESLLVASAASCFILTFRAVARAAKLDWMQLECAVAGTLDRKDGASQFTKMVTRARLTIPASTPAAAAEAALTKAERGCLVANSLRAERELHAEIVHDEPQVPAAD